MLCATNCGTKGFASMQNCPPKPIYVYKGPQTVACPTRTESGGLKGHIEPSCFKIQIQSFAQFTLSSSDDT